MLSSGVVFVQNNSVLLFAEREEKMAQHRDFLDQLQFSEMYKELCECKLKSKGKHS